MILSIWQIYNIFYFIAFYIYIFKSGRKMHPYWVFATAMVNIFISLFYLVFV